MHGSDVDPARAASLPSTRGALARSAALALGLGPAVCVAVLACGASREGPASETSPPADTTTASDGAPAGDSRPGDTPAQDVAVAETSPPSECAGDPFSEAFMRRAIETLAQPAWEGRRFDSVGLRTEDDCYHRPCDTPDRIDYPNLGRILRLAADLTEALAVDADLATARAEFHDAREAVAAAVVEALGVAGPGTAGGAVRRGRAR